MIRPIREEDAQGFLELGQVLDAETSFMLMEPGERSLDAEEQRRFIAASAPLRAIWVAEVDGSLAGFLGATRGAFRRNRHSAHMAMGVRQRYWRRGIGSALVQAFLRWAEANQLRRLELTVMTHNAAAIALYHDHGFRVEGRRAASLHVDGAPVDEYLMARVS